MITRLAKLADLKKLVAPGGTTETTHDELLTVLIERASARAEELVGHSLLRQTVTEYPADPACHSRFFRVRRWPIESITSIKQAMEAMTASEFSLETALVENDDYVVDSERGKIERINSVWYLNRNWLQVIYTGGFGDPANLEVYATGSSNADAVNIRAGEVTIGGVELVYAGATAAVDSLTNNATTYIWIANDGSGLPTIASAVAATGWPGTAHEKLAEVTMRGGAIARILDRRSHLPPPLDLQQGVLYEALQNWNYRTTGGVADVQLAGGGGFRADGLDPHEALVTACNRYRSLM